MPVGVYDHPPPEGSGYVSSDVTDDWSAPVELIAGYTRLQARLNDWVQEHLP